MTHYAKIVMKGVVWLNNLVTLQAGDPSVNQT